MYTLHFNYNYVLGYDNAGYTNNDDEHDFVGRRGSRSSGLWFQDESSEHGSRESSLWDFDYWGFLDLFIIYLSKFSKESIF